MPPKIGELQITNNYLGQPIAGGKIIWLYGYETIAGIELETGTPIVAVKFFPGPSNPDFKEPVIVMLAERDIENFLKAIRIAQAGLHPSISEGGTA